MALIMINENDGYTPKTLYRVLSCVVYSLIANYFCIDYLSCQSKHYAKLQRIQHLKNEFQFITWYWHYRTVTEPCILSCIHVEIEFNCDIKFPNLFD